jgi:cell division topological specificity factor
MRELWASFFDKKPKSASAAKERLQIIIAREHSGRASYDFIPQLHREIIELISKYIQVDPAAIHLALDRKDDIEVLELNVVLPDDLKCNTRKVV